MHMCVWHKSFICVIWPNNLWYDSFIRVTGRFHTDDRFIRMTRPIYACDRTYSYVQSDSFICVTLLIHNASICETWLVHVWDTHTYTHTHIHTHTQAHWYAWQSTFMWDIHTYTHIHTHTHTHTHTFIRVTCVIHDAFMRVTHDLFATDAFTRVIHLIRPRDTSHSWRSLMCDITHSYVWRDAFLRVTSRIHTCDVTHALSSMPTYEWVTRLVSCGHQMWLTSHMTHRVSTHDNANSNWYFGFI